MKHTDTPSLKKKIKQIQFLYKPLKSIKWACLKTSVGCTVFKFFFPKEFIAPPLVSIPSGTIKEDIKISVCVPLFNTPPHFLHEMIQSLQNQSYGNWELCLADGSSQHNECEKICTEYAQKDVRIRYQKLGKNLGISENTNVALAMAQGTYIALLDHDDLLHKDALAHVALTISQFSADFIYTDELLFIHSPRFVTTTIEKEDYTLEKLRSSNMIGHLAVFSKNLMQEAGGGFCSEFDGAQDYDLYLRLAEKAKKIVHISEFLYAWRQHPGSIATGEGAKPYVLDAGKYALTAHLKREKIPGDVEHVPGKPGFYRIKG